MPHYLLASRWRICSLLHTLPPRRAEARRTRSISAPPAFVDAFTFEDVCPGGVMVALGLLLKAMGPRITPEARRSLMGAAWVPLHLVEASLKELSADLDDAGGLPTWIPPRDAAAMGGELFVRSQSGEAFESFPRSLVESRRRMMELLSSGARGGEVLGKDT